MPSVLIADDEPNIRRMVGALLRAEGYEVREAPDGRGAVTQAAETEPDVALVDVGLPGFDGYEVARRVRAEDKSIRLIALTGYGQPDDRRRALEAGFDAHLVKPVDFETLDEAIRAPRAEP